MNPAYDPIIAEASRRFNVPEDILRAVMSQESGGRPGSVSPKGASGLMQIMPPTYNELAGKHGLGPDRFDPRNNIMGGAAYLRQMNDQFGGSWNDTFGAYNAGPGRWSLVKAGKANAPAETTDYISRVNQRLGNTGDTVAFNPMVPRLERPRPGQTITQPGYYPDNEKEFRGLLDQEPVPAEQNGQDGLGTLTGAGQTPTQPPGPSINGRINDMIQQLSQPVAPGPRLTPGQYRLAGASDALTPLAGVHDRRVGIGELLGALGGGLSRGTLAAQEAGQKERATQFGELANMSTIQKYQRGEATNAAKVEGARRLAAQLRSEAQRTGNTRLLSLAAAIENDPSNVDNILPKMAEQAFPKPPAPYNVPAGAVHFDSNNNPVAAVDPAPQKPPAPHTVTLGNGPEGPGVYSLKPDGSLGPRLGSSETGTDNTIETQTPEQLVAAGAALNLPPPGPSPLDNPALSPRGRSNLVKSLQTQNEKRIEKSTEAADSAQKMLGLLGRFTNLNKTNETGGGIYGGGLAGWVRGVWDDEFKEMQSITAQITPTLRQPGSGSTSDFDAQMFMKGTVNVDNSKETNLAIAQGMEAALKNVVAKAEFEALYAQTYGHLNGADVSWRDYLNHNPIFDPASPGSYTANPNWKDWRTYFGKAPDTTTLPPPPPGAVIGGP
jgi:hypothetical protein